MKSFIADAINNYISSIIDEALKMFTVFLSGLSSIAPQVLDMPVVQNGIALSQTVCLGVLAVKVAYEALMIYILRTNGDPQASPQQLLIGTVKAVAIITCIPWLIDWLFQWGATLTRDVAALPGAAEIKSVNAFTSVVKLIMAAEAFPLFLAIAVVFALILFVVIVIQSFLRGGELVVAAVIGAFMALGLTNGSSSFAQWLKEIMAISFTQAAQMFLVKVSFGALQTAQFGNPWFSVLLFIAMLFVTIKVPSTLKQFAHSTGFGKASGGATQTVLSTAIQKFIHK